MTAPIGEPPEMDSFIEMAENHLSHYNIEATGIADGGIYLLEGDSNGHHIQVEFKEPSKKVRQRRGSVDTIEEEIWSEMQYKIFVDDELVRDRNYTFDYKFNDNQTWDRQLSKFLMTVSGPINGEIR